jgi:DNA-binding transcriptional regulator YiaG
MNNKYSSESMQVIHEDVNGMYQLKIISDARMRKFDEMCLVQNLKQPILPIL